MNLSFEGKNIGAEGMKVFASVPRPMIGILTISTHEVTQKIAK